MKSCSTLLFLKQKKGVIINMSSVFGKVGFANSSHFIAAKHGVIGLIQSAALEYTMEGIRINALCPGFVETPLLTNAGIRENTDPQKYIIGLHPMKRLGTS
jgi:NAD(P)-dependent dehydrogenase (short-subunit alcohol dehydrogenase family)